MDHPPTTSHAARSTRPVSRGGWLLALGGPIGALTAVLIAHADWRLWLALSQAARGRMVASLFLLEAALVVVVAPLCGVAVVSTLRSVWSPVWSPVWSIVRLLALPATLFACVSAGLALAVLGTAAWRGGADGALSLIAISHATLWTETIALAALGALCASTMADPLDAAACSVGFAIFAAGGVLVLGPAVADAPVGAIDAALLASPIAAAASAANIDILRNDVLYRLSPLAHQRFDYPAWQTVFACYAGVAFVCFFAMALNLARRDRACLAERIST